MSTRYERERAAWVLARAGRRAAARRRGEKLAVKARRADREQAGAGDAAFVEVTTRNVFTRNVMREEGPANVLGWFVLTATWMFWLAVLLGPALVLGAALYGLSWALVPRLGRVRSWPFLVASLCALLGSVLVFWLLPPDGWAAWVLTGYLALQLVVGPLRAAYLARANGWAAVAKRAKGSAAKIAPIDIAVTVEDAPAPATDPAPESTPDKPAFVVEVGGGETGEDDPFPDEDDPYPDWDEAEEYPHENGVLR